MKKWWKKSVNLADNPNIKLKSILKYLDGLFTSKRKQKENGLINHGLMRKNKTDKRRAKNRVARASRRVNKIRRRGK